MDETTNTTTAAVTTASNSKIKEYAMLILVGIVVAFGFAVLARIFSVTVFYAVLFVEMVATCVLLEVLLRALEGPSKVKDLLRKIATIAWMVPIFIFFVSLVIHVTGGSMLDSMVMMEKIGWKHVLFDGSTKQMEINLIIGLIGIWLSWRLAFGSFAGAKKSKGLASGIFALLAIIIIAREYIPIVPALERYGQATMVASADTIDVQAMGVEANMNPRVYIATTNLYEMGKNGKELLFNKGDKMALVSTKVRKEGQESMVEVIRELDEKFEEPLQTHWVQWRLIRPEPEVAKKEVSTPAPTAVAAPAQSASMTVVGARYTLSSHKARKTASVPANTWVKFQSNDEFFIVNRLGNEPNGQEILEERRMPAGESKLFLKLPGDIKLKGTREQQQVAVIL